MVETRVVAMDAQAHFPALDPSQARALLEQLLEALASGMRAPLPIARKTAFTRLQAEHEGRDAGTAARLSYDRDDAGQRFAEVDEDAYLQRAWPAFESMLEAGFERWLPLYRAVAQHVRWEDGA
jgi:exodeoxyribonuclease V gamma subunit